MYVDGIRFDKFPFFLAPMEDVTDAPFRRICKEFGADVVFSEFASSDALIRHVQPTFNKLHFDDSQRPFAIQIFGNRKDIMCEAARIAESFHPDFIDINWGCPVKKVAGKCAGSGILQHIPQMIDITQAVVKSVKLPVTVKTRLGYDDRHKPIVELSEKLQDVGIKMLTIHGRTKSQMYKGEADWTLIGKIKENPRIVIPVIGNGDITSAQKAQEYKNRYNVDGIMIGRAAIGNPWIFSECDNLINKNINLSQPSIAERLSICRRHFQLALEEKGTFYGILNMRKHYKHYFKELSHFKELRIQLLTSDNAEDIEQIFQRIAELYSKN
jgi:nifR3 family TIM-barrel protein